MPVTRRSFLQASAALAATGPLRAFAQDEAPTRVLFRLPYSAVELLPGPLLTQQQHQHQLFLSLDEAGLLKPFRQLSGLPAPGEDLGGWYSPSPLFDPPKNMTGYIPGHSFGQYLSALARFYSITGDPDTQAKVHRLTAAVAPAITPRFYAGYCLPAYTSDKLTCGLMDAHQFAQDPNALAALDRATDAVLPYLPPKALDRREMEALPHPNPAFTWDESYTLPENLYLASTRGAGPRYRVLARRFLQDDTYFGPLSRGENVLPGQHAYSHVNALCSALQCYFADGSAMHLQAAQNGFRFVLEQSLPNGVWGPDETFRVPNSPDFLHAVHTTPNTFETPCGTYGHFKAARYLLQATGDPTYGDSMELLLYNAILGALPTDPSGATFYYADFSDIAQKRLYDQPWPCCSGTFPQLAADFGISAYLRSPRGLFINLFVPSRVRFLPPAPDTPHKSFSRKKQDPDEPPAAAPVTLIQTTAYPASPVITFTLALATPQTFSLSLRIPAWAGPTSHLRLNDERLDLDLHPGTAAEIRREWAGGDRLELILDMPLRLVPLSPAEPRTVALLRGPLALHLLDPASTPSLSRAELLAAAPTVTPASATLAFPDYKILRPNAPPLTLRPFANITPADRYRLLHRLT